MGHHADVLNKRKKRVDHSLRARQLKANRKMQTGAKVKGTSHATAPVVSAKRKQILERRAKFAAQDAERDLAKRGVSVKEVAALADADGDVSLTRAAPAALAKAGKKAKAAKVSASKAGAAMEE